jgi:hypothetical protein
MKTTDITAGRRLLLGPLLRRQEREFNSALNMVSERRLDVRASNSTATCRVSPVTAWISPDVALPRSEHHWALRRMADRLDAMAVRIQHEGAVIIGVVVRPKPRRAIVAPAGGERRSVKGENRRSVGRSEAEMGAADRRPHLSFASDGEFYAKRAGYRTVVGAAAVPEVDDTHEPKGTLRAKHRTFHERLRTRRFGPFAELQDRPYERARAARNGLRPKAWGLRPDLKEPLAIDVRQMRHDKRWTQEELAGRVECSLHRSD